MNLYAILLIITFVMFPFICGYVCRWNRQVDIAGDASTTVNTRRLDRRVVSSLPVFAHSSATAEEAKMECAVCLGEFRDGDKCRLLPACNHSFHRACVDAWFSTTSTCPLCRAVVEDPEAAV